MMAKNDGESKGFWDSKIGTAIGETGVLLVAGALLGLAVGAIFCAMRGDSSPLPYFVIGIPILLILWLRVRTFLDEHLTTYRKNSARPPFFKDSTVLGEIFSYACFTGFIALMLALQNHRFWLIPLGIIFSSVVIGIGCMFDRRKVWKKADRSGSGNAPGDGKSSDGTAGSSGDGEDSSDGDIDEDEIQMPYYTPEIWM
jgi:MFS family permease